MSRGGRARTGAAQLPALLHAWRESLPSEQWRGLPAAWLAASGARALQFGARRRPGQALLRVLGASDAAPAGADGTAIELITEDMPFLVDTLQMGIAQAGLPIRLIIHPILQVRRDAAGRLQMLHAAVTGSAPDAGGVRESWQYLQIDAIGAAEQRALLARLRSALADLRRACRDWPRMRRVVLELCADIARHPPALAAEVIGESRALLQYMEADHFTFLGVRENRLRRTARGPQLLPVAHTSLGVLRRRSHHAADGGAATRSNIRRALRSHELLVITKANTRSSVHRSGYLDYIGVKRFDRSGRVIGEVRILGLWTSSTYSADARSIPWVRLKLQHVIEHFPFAPGSHDAKRLVQILEGLPRDELLQASVADLIRCARAVLSLQERTRVRVVLRRDEFRRFWSCLVYLPRERCDAAAQARIAALLRAALHGGELDASLSIGDAPLAQLHVVVQVAPDAAARVDAARLERRIDAALIRWRDRLHAALVGRFGQLQGSRLERAYAGAFPASYRQDDHEAAAAADDIADLEDLDRAPEAMQLRLYRPHGQRAERIHLRILRRGETLSVSEVLPTFEHFGLRVIAERPYRLDWPDGSAAWVQDFELEHYARQPVVLARIGAELIGAFRAVRAGELDDDGFNRLLIAAQLSARAVTVLRACCRYLLQTGIALSQSYMERVLSSHPAAARDLVQLFEQRLTPAPARAAAARATLLERRVRRAIGALASADEDRILRAFLAVILAVLRTNYFVRDAHGTPRAWLALKLDCARIPGLPQPRPRYEIFVHSPRLEAVHLRQGPIARGGIRWSERPEDFRTEILGLMKAQHVKNTLIVPVGAKGGFVARRLSPESTREAAQREIVECYAHFMRGLLDLTDNIVQGRIVAPAQVRRLDGDDPYLVVAADKGTASFSDLANSISAEYDFWLGDAFASGGSAGYDHKKMGITARGGWECVKRHFRELGRDIQREPVTVAGIGDMSGDVFGNGMLQSRQIRLVAAFNHQHIFIDPKPDRARSFSERARLLRLPRSGWGDYRRELLSRGGAIYPRSAKQVPLSAEAQALLDLPQRRASPTELIRAILCMRVDLLWNGGIGTYVKAASERHGEIADRANDALRVDGAQVRALVVGEGGNLGFSQRGRIEYAAAAGRINADFIDNSAGVNTSDVEVNLKILLDAANGAAPLPRARRNRLLAAATDEIAALVVRNNYLQSQAISVMQQRASAELGEHQRLLRWLERHGALDRAVECLPTDEELDERRRQGRGLTRPELALLLAYGKIALNHALTESGGAADPYLARELQRYFPQALRRRYPERIEHHRLRAQIIITATTNSCVHRVGPALLMECAEHGDTNAADVARAYTIARDSAELRALWSQIEALDGRVEAEDQYEALWQTSRFLRHVTLWLLSHRREFGAVGAAVARLQPALREFRQVMPGALAGLDRERHQQQRRHYLERGFPPHLAQDLALLEPLQLAPELCVLTATAGARARVVAHAHFKLGERLGLDWLEATIRQLPAGGNWQGAARARLHAAAVAAHLHLTGAVLRGERSARTRGGTAAGAMEPALQRWQQLLSDLRAVASADLAALTVALEALENLAAARPQSLAHLL
ncbi:MAG TPA: NAD-glutamate dehydrogenase [Steroidobacteraceae bacterium]|jgi:glutamate dehydrogenase|nr:NAD-glutamate dehydrogenase [Steroidobacteraceae bacterium]